MQQAFRRTFPWQTADDWSMTSEIWQGSDDRMPVLIVHGLGEHSGRYESFAIALSERGHTVIIPDLRGHGKSSGSRGDTPSFQHLVDDLVTLQQQLQRQRVISRQPLVLGHSMGGAIATAFAFQYTTYLSGLFLISPFYREAFEPKWWRLLAGQVFYQVYPALALDVGLRLDQLAHDQDLREQIAEDPLTHQRLSARWAMEARTAAHQLPYSRQLLEIPTAIAHGDQDQVTHPDASRFFAEHQNHMRAESGQCPLVEYQLIENGLHQIHNDARTRELVLDQFERLIQRIHQGGCLDCPEVGT